jgi:hypothetical protein
MYLCLFRDLTLGKEPHSKIFLDNLEHTAAEARVPFFVVRVPWPLGRWWRDEAQRTRVMQLPKGHGRLKVCRASLESDVDLENMADTDGGSDALWRLGALFEPNGRNADGYLVINYAVFTSEYSKQKRSVREVATTVIDNITRRIFV